MSAIDDHSLLAMRDARMSLDSIAQTMGWSVTRTQKRLAHLDTLARGDGASSDRSGPGQQDEEPGPEPMAPIAIGQGLVLRTFVVPAGGYGAACEIADGRHVYTLTGAVRPEAGSRIPVRQDGEVWRHREAAHA